MIEFLVERNLKKMKDEELVDFYIQNSQSMSLSLKKKFVIESAKRELSKLGVNDCSVKVNLLFEGCGGAFREAKHKKEILINERVLLNSSPIEVFGIIKHECTHALQCKKEKEFPIDDYAIKINYSRSRYNESLNFCDFCFENCQMYITNEFDISFEANELAEMFYYLGAAEREAFILEYARNEELCEKNGILHSKTNKVGEQANFFRKHYKCFNLTDEEIFEIIDLSYSNLINGKYPNHDEKGNLCANIMYDLCIVSGGISGCIDNLKAIEYLKPSVKHEILLSYRYSNVDFDSPSNSLYNEFEYYLNNLEKLKDMSDAFQKDNPKLLSSLCVMTGGKAIEYVKDPDYLFKKVTEMSFTSERFEEIFGDEFTKHFESNL